MKFYGVYRGPDLIMRGTAADIQGKLNLTLPAIYQRAQRTRRGQVKKKNALRIYELSPGKTYEAYKGYQLLAAGTARQVAEALGVKVGTVRYLASPSHFGRIGESDNAIFVLKTDFEEFEGFGNAKNA